jgi:chromosome segregation ATPase
VIDAGEVAAIITSGAAAIMAVGGYLLNRSQSKRNATEAESTALTASAKLIEVQQKRIDQLHTDVEDAEKATDIRSEKLQTALARLDSNECTLRELQSELRVANANISALEQELITARAENAQLQARVLELESERAQWESERKRLQKQITSLVTEVREYRKQAGKSIDSDCEKGE